MWCDSDDCPRPDDALDDGSDENYPHTFSGYGWYCKYHPECCPGAMDGTDCSYEHPEGWVAHPLLQ